MTDTRKFSKLDNKLVYLPLYVVVFYVAFGLFVSITGPLEYLGYEPFMTFLYLVGSMLSLSVGYHFGTKALYVTKKSDSVKKASEVVRRIFVACAVMAAVITTATIVYTAATRGLSFNIMEAGNTYRDLYADYVRNDGQYSLVFLITSFGSAFTFICTVWGIYYFSRVEKWMKFLILYCIFGALIVFTIGDGKQKQFGDLAVYVVAILAIKRASENKLTSKFVCKVVFILLATVSILLVLLSLRYRAVGIDAINLYTAIHPLIAFNEDHWILSFFGNDIGFAVTMLSGYFGGGYYGLSLTLLEPFTWTWFAGSSYSVSVVVDQLGGPFPVEDSYPYLVGDSFGWGQSKWHTVFPWLASDLTWPGSVLFLGLVGYVYAVSWRESIKLNNPFSVLLFSLLSVGMAFIPANNQLMHSPGGFLLLISILFLYYTQRGKYNYQALQTARPRRKVRRIRDALNTAKQ